MGRSFKVREKFLWIKIDWTRNIFLVCTERVNKKQVFSRQTGRLHV